MRPSGRGRAGAWVLLGLAALGVAATALSIERSRADARDRDRQAVDLVAVRVASSLLSTVSSLRVNDPLVADGLVTADEFELLAEDVIPESEFVALAYAEPVAAADRSEWEAVARATIVDPSGTGWVTAPQRDRHVAVRYVVPVDDSTRSLVGFDLLGDEVRGRGIAEASASEHAVVVGPIPLATTGDTGLFFADAVRHPDGSVAGYVSGGIDVLRFVAIAETLPDVEPVSLWMDGRLLVGDGGGATASFSAAGRTFTVASGDRRDASWLLPVIIGFGTALLVAATVVAGRRDTRERERQRWLSRRNQRLAEFAERLAVTTTTDDVVRVTLDHAGSMVGAAHTSVARRDLIDPSKLHVVDETVVGDRSARRGSPRNGRAESGLSDDGLIERLARVGDGTPISDCVARGTAVVLPDLDALAHEHPHLLDDARRHGRVATVCVPLGLGTEPPRGAIACAWAEQLAAHRIDDLVAATQLVAQMVGRALERAQVREVVQGRIDVLADLARALTTASTRHQVADVVEHLLPSVVGVRSASLAPGDARPDDAPVRSYPLQSTEDVHLHLVLDASTPWNATLESFTHAVLDFVAGAWDRAALYDHEHSVVQRFQSTLLTAPPVVDGFDIAVAYRSAMEAVGIGGDWYSVIAHPDGLSIVIGDIAGHGPGAVAHMAEVKTIMRHLLTNGASIEDAVRHAHEVLERRDACASAIVVHIDRSRQTLRFINAGHLGPIVIGPDGVTALADLHRPWLGVPGDQRPASEVPFPPGSTLLLYTDGLVEERGETIDTSIDRLVDSVTATDATPSALVEHLLQRRVSDRRPTTVDDDIALVAVARR